jgi:hypothetical protein
MKKYFKKNLNETSIKIILIGLMIIGIIFLRNHQISNSEFNISDMSILNSIPNNENRILDSTIINCKKTIFS